MDPEFSRLVDEAAAIAASGRWAAVNERIKHLAADPGVGNDWWVQLFASLCAQIFSEYLLLKRAHGEKENGDAPLLAWRARNLLELSVWSTYCARNRENARRLYEDAGRDALGLYNAFTKWGGATAQSTDWLEPIANAKQDLSQRAVSEGIESLDGPYKQVKEAARRVRNRGPFQSQLPSAIQILPPDRDANSGLSR